MASEKKLKKILDLSEGDDLTPDNNIYNKILAELQNKFKSAGKSVQIQILTLFIDHLPYSEIAKLFDTTTFFIKKAHDVKRESGILGLPKPKIGKILVDNIKERVILVFSDPSFKHVRMMPGKKDCVSVSKGVYEQKRLLLLNLREIYQSYKEHYPLDKIDFSKFCSLRPKFCKLPGTSRTHSVCNCIYHQNVKLLLLSLNVSLNYRDILSELVCDVNNDMCMTGECPICFKNKNEMKACVQKIPFSSDDFDFDGEIVYKQWIQTDRSEMITHISTYDKFLDLLADKFKKLLPHHYITRKQSEFL